MLKNGSVVDATLIDAPVPGDQVPIRFHQGALPRIDEEHRAAHYLVCAVQFVDGS